MPTKSRPIRTPASPNPPRPIRAMRPNQSNQGSRKRLRRISNVEDDDHYEPSDDSDSSDDTDVDLNPPATSTRNNRRQTQIHTVDDDLLERLSRQITPEATNPRDPLPNIPDINQDDSAVEDLDNLPSVTNYKSVIDEWPLPRIAVVDRQQKKKQNVVPPQILTEAQAIQTLYKQQKSLLAIMGNVSMFTLDKALGELGGRRRPSGYQIFLKYSNEIRPERMPKKGGEKGILANRNRILGAKWTALPLRHREVFSPPVFYALSGLTYSKAVSKDNEDMDDSEDEAEVQEAIQTFEFEPGERAEFEALYDELVWKAKVAKEYSKLVSGKSQGPTLPDFNRQSLKCIERLHNQIEDESKNMGFSYYLLACSTYASSEVDTSSRGWCKEYTSHDDMATYVNKKCNFATLFGATAQGLSVAEIVAETIGGHMKNKQSARKADAGDVVKSKLAGTLRSKLSALLGRDQGFPHGPDPEAIFKARGYNIKIVQLPGSTLPQKTLKLSFARMNRSRSLWLDDINADLFKLEKIPSNVNVGGLNENEDEFDEEVINTQISQDIDEEEEWNGLGF
ncbi:uncharacterized protein MELLADRAFT_96238 [Melampsora larici-populina 98AG31]|uniref:Uncharacterized protein n=1 Tax=Melampsora larici-populina (strain 98AG31 / pathotype 3-4-7) TaxID=747676 RepID=F4SBF1_MELLP|nr:uncharacterized protein MELLADRAFT_96238 [Melampsora larici-populina 98AG31]EGF98018.1 hypothetical protein MELLADRAFT_96238 [Melampsora larici-populina 98AG31]